MASYILKKNAIDCLVSLVVLSATATLESLDSIPRSSKVLLGFSMKFSVARSWICARLNDNRLASYYMGPKHTGELWVYIGTPLPNPSVGKYRQDGM